MNTIIQDAAAHPKVKEFLRNNFSLDGWAVEEVASFIIEPELHRMGIAEARKELRRELHGGKA